MKFFSQCKHISCFDWNKKAVSCIGTRRRLIFQPCCIYFTFWELGTRRKKECGFNFQSFFFVRCIVYTYDYLHASLAEATPNDNPFVFYSSSSLRSMFCVFDFAFLMLFPPLSLSLSRPSYDEIFPRCMPEKKRVVHIH